MSTLQWTNMSWLIGVQILEHLLLGIKSCFHKDINIDNYKIYILYIDFCVPLEPFMQKNNWNNVVTKIINDKFKP